MHLYDWPQPAERDAELEVAMGVVRETVRLGLAARGQAKLKVRQPLHSAVVVAAGSERAAIERLARLVHDELNVKELRFVSRPTSSALRGQAELPCAGPAFRQGHAGGGGGRRGARPRARATRCDFAGAACPG